MYHVSCKVYENYSVSNSGNIRNGKTGGNPKPQLNEKDHKIFKLNWKRYKIHRLVAIVIPNSKKQDFRRKY